MKKLSIIITLMVLGIGTVFAQAPNLFNYQGVARDAKGAPLANKTLSLKLSVISAVNAGVADYEETQTTTTNEFGLYTLQVGGGNAITGTLERVNWESGNKYLQVAIDVNGGTNYEIVGSAQLLSVPYAMFANKAKVAGSGTARSGGVSTAPSTTGDANMIPKFTGNPNELTNSRIFDGNFGGNKIGFGTNQPDHDYSFYRGASTNPNTGNTVQIKSDNDDAFARLRFKASGTGNPSSELVFSKLGPNAAGNYMGMPRANMTAVNSNGEPGDYVMVGTRNIVYGTFEGGVPTEKWRMTPDGKIGLGIKNPESKFEVRGTEPYTKATVNANVGISIFDQTSIPATFKYGMYSNVSGASGENIGILSQVQGTSSYNSGILGNVIADPGLGNFSYGIVAQDITNTNNTGALYVSGKSEFDGTAVMDSVFADHVATPSLAVDTLYAYRVKATEMQVQGTNAHIGLLANGTTENFYMNNNDDNSLVLSHGAMVGNNRSVQIDTNQVVIGKGTIPTFTNTLVLSEPLGTNAGIALFSGPQANNITTDTNGNLQFILNSTSSTIGSPYYLMTMDDDKKNVGINNINPEATLDVKGFKPITPPGGIGTVHAAVAVSDTASNSKNIGFLTNINGGTTENVGFAAEVNSTSGSGTGVRAVIRTAGSPGLPNIGFYADERTGNQYSIALRTNGKVQHIPSVGAPNELVMNVSGRADFSRETTIDTLISDTISSISTTTANLQVTGGAPGNGKVLTSDAAGNATWKSNTTGGSASTGSSAYPVADTNRFLTFQTVTITSTTQKVLVNAHRALGSTDATGANDLRIYIGYQLTTFPIGTTVINTTTSGMFGLRCATNTRQVYSVSDYITGLAPGTYRIGMVGRSTTTEAPKWNNNEFGETTIVVFE